MPSSSSHSAPSTLVEQACLYKMPAVVPTTPTSSKGKPSASPSLARRMALLEADAPNRIQVLDAYPISKYRNLAKRLLGHFEEAYYKSQKTNRGLDEAYVYGMRFAQLIVQDLPNHNEWVSCGPIDQELKPHIEKVLSRLEIVKRKMDDEELNKIRVRMLALAAHEETKRQRKQQEERLLELKGNVPEEESTSLTSSTPASEVFLAENHGKKKSKTKAKIGRLVITATEKTMDVFGVNPTTQNKVRQFVRGTPNRTKETPNGKHGTSSPLVAPEGEPSTVLPSLIAIRRSREQQPEDLPLIVNRYKIETKQPVVNEVKLTLESAQTQSLLNLQHQLSPRMLPNKEVPLTAQNLSVWEHQQHQTELPMSPVSFPDLFASNRAPERSELSSKSSDVVDKPLSLEPSVPMVGPIWEKNLTETTLHEASKILDGTVDNFKQTDSTGSFGAITSPSPKRSKKSFAYQSGLPKDVIDFYQAVIEELTKTLASMYTGHHVVVFNDQGSVTSVYTSGDEKPFSPTDTKRFKSNESFAEGDHMDDLIDAFDSFPNRPIGDSSIKGRTVLGDHEQEGKNDSGEYIVADKFMEYTFDETDFQEMKPPTDSAVPSPSCVATDKVAQLHNKLTKCSHPNPLPEIHVETTPLRNIAISPRINDDEVTLLTMEECFLQAESIVNESLSKETEQKLRDILYKELWSEDIDSVHQALEDLYAMLSQKRKAMKAHLSQLGEIIALLMKRKILRFPDAEGIQFLSCSILCLLAMEPEQQVILRQMEIVKLISDSMTHHPESQRIQKAARCTIETLCSQ